MLTPIRSKLRYLYIKKRVKSGIFIWFWQVSQIFSDFVLIMGWLKFELMSLVISGNKVYHLVELDSCKKKNDNLHLHLHQARASCELCNVTNSNIVWAVNLRRTQCNGDLLVSWMSTFFEVVTSQTTFISELS